MLTRRSRVARRVMSSSLIAVAVMVPLANGVPPAAARTCPPAAVFDVLNNNDSGGASLRQAILDANANAVPGACPADAIEFTIPATGPQVITLTSDLPDITDPVNIRGYTQTGAVPATTAPATIEIWIDATNAGNGLV